MRSNPPISRRGYILVTAQSESLNRSSAELGRSAIGRIHIAGQATQTASHPTVHGKHRRQTPGPTGKLAMTFLSGYQMFEDAGLSALSTLRGGPSEAFFFDACSMPFSAEMMVRTSGTAAWNSPSKQKHSSTLSVLSAIPVPRIRHRPLQALLAERPTSAKGRRRHPHWLRPGGIGLLRKNV
jgi:hypothetical protein